MKYLVHEISGRYCITSESGQRLYRLIYSELSLGKPVEVDFQGIKVFASPFFNFAVGQLYRNFTSAELTRLLEISNLNANGKSVMKSVIENAKQYYSNDQFREIETRLIEEYASSF